MKTSLALSSRAMVSKKKKVAFFDTDLEKKNQKLFLSKLHTYSKQNKEQRTKTQKKKKTTTTTSF